MHSDLLWSSTNERPRVEQVLDICVNRREVLVVLDALHEVVVSCFRLHDATCFLRVLSDALVTDLKMENIREHCAIAFGENMMCSDKTLKDIVFYETGK